MAVGAKALHHVVDRQGLIAFGQSDARHGDIVNAKGLMTMLTIKMSMHVVIVVVVMTHTQLIAYTVAPVLYHVQQVMLAEEG